MRQFGELEAVIMRRLRADGTERALRIGILTGFSRPDAAPV
jgi:hypothetical protein